MEKEYLYKLNISIDSRGEGKPEIQICPMLIHNKKEVKYFTKSGQNFCRFQTYMDVL